MMQDADDSYSVADVNLNYWYDEADIAKILRASLQQDQLQLSMQQNGIIIDRENNLYKNQGCSFSCGINIEVDSDLRLYTRSMDSIAKAIDEVIIWNKQQLAQNKQQNIIQRHQFLFNLNIANKHWGVLMLRIDVLQHNLDFDLHTSFWVTVHDSLGLLQDDHIYNLQNNLQNILKSKAQDESQSKVHASIGFTRTQPDSNSCGPIVVQKIVHTILQQKPTRNSVQPYSITEIVQLRLQHIRIVSDLEFINKQKQAEVVSLQKKQLSTELFGVAIKLHNFINTLHNIEPIDQLIHQFKLLVEADKQQERFAKGQTEPTKLMLNHAEQLQLVKKWFQDHHSQLAALDIMQYFFSPQTSSNNNSSSLELVWSTNGLDCLISVLRRIVVIYSGNSVKPTPQLANTNTNLEQFKYLDFHFKGILNQNANFRYGTLCCMLGPEIDPKHIAVYHGGIDENFISEAGKISLHASNQEQPLASCRVKKISNQYSLVCEENSVAEDEYRKFCDHIVQYATDFRLGNCVLKQHIPELDITAYFNGMRDADGSFWRGKIQAFIGEPMNNNEQLVCHGTLAKGNLDGELDLYLYAKNVSTPVYKMPSYANRGKIVRFSCFDANRTELRIEAAKIIFDRIAQHIATYSNDFRFEYKNLLKPESAPRYKLGF